MKHLITCALLLAIIASSGCKKGSATNSNSSDVIITPPPAPKPPVAVFRITNSTDHGVLEANYLNFENTSQNGDSYTWDFGDGTTSTEKIPTNFYYGACSTTYTITLTVKNKAGQTATFSNFYHVACTRGGGPHALLAPARVQ